MAALRVVRLYVTSLRYDALPKFTEITLSGTSDVLIRDISAMDKTQSLGLSINLLTGEGSLEGTLRTAGAAAHHRYHRDSHHRKNTDGHHNLDQGVTTLGAMF